MSSAEGQNVNDLTKLLIVVIFSALICSSVELYFFLALPIYVTINGSFTDGRAHWDLLTYYGNSSFSVSLDVENEIYNGCPYRVSFALRRCETYTPNMDDIWFKIFQNVASHPLTKSTKVTLKLLLKRTDLELLINQSDAMFIYVGFMLQDKMEKQKYFCIYGWTINGLNSDKIKITPETFKDLKYWTILDIEELQVDLNEGLELSFERYVWPDIVNKTIPIDNSWHIKNGVELGFMIWNLNLDENETLTIRLNCFDITYRWPAIYSILNQEPTDLNFTNTSIN